MLEFRRLETQGLVSFSLHCSNLQILFKCFFFLFLLYFSFFNFFNIFNILIFVFVFSNSKSLKRLGLAERLPKRKSQFVV